MIKAVVFDVGGVLVRTEDRAPRARLGSRFGLGIGGADDLVFNSDMGTQAQLGAITAGELWEWIGQTLKVDEAGLVAFREEFYAGDKLDETLVAYIRRLRPKYQTAIISNYADNLLHDITERYPMSDAFDIVVGSAYEGVTKPDKQIFERTLARLGREPAEAVFIDDFAHNVAGARAAGLYAIHYQPGIDVPTALASLGVEPSDTGEVFADRGPRVDMD